MFPKMQDMLILTGMYVKVADWEPKIQETIKWYVPRPNNRTDLLLSDG